MLSSVFTLLAAAPKTEPDGDVVGWITESARWMLEQIQGHNWLPAAALAVMVLVWAVRKLFLAKLDPKWMPVVSAGIGVLTLIAGNLITLAAGYDTMSVLSIVLSGLLLGTSASGFWDLV